MRGFPIILPIARIALGPQIMRLGSNTYLLPSGTGVVVNNTAIYHDLASWPSPTIIEPRRCPYALVPGEPSFSCTGGGDS